MTSDTSQPTAATSAAIASIDQHRAERLPVLCVQVFDPDKVIFINDIFYCANDLLRLLLHKADLACGLDLVHNYWKGYLFYDFW